MSLGMPPQAFFGYASRPPLRRTTIKEAASALTATGEVSSMTWEQLSTSGRLIITEIMSAIDASVLSVFEVTDPNENVLFEVGYAIGRNRPIWLLRDASYTASARRWDKFVLLKPIGQSRYSNSDDIVEALTKERPYQRTSTILQQLVNSDDPGPPTTSVLYLASPHDTNAERAILRTLERERSRNFTLATADPRETAVQPLAWYAESIAAARGVVAHFTSPNRQDADIHNARVALLSGLARGLDKPVLMLAEEDYATPIDYQDVLYVYSVPREAVGRLNAWLREKRSLLAAPTGERSSEALGRVTKLKTLRLGSHVAENEATSLSDYFVQTRPYVDVLDGGVRLFVGRKGAGKTAILLQAADEIAIDVRNIVCTIKPPGYELESLLRLLRSYRDKDTKGYLIESIWKFLLFSELAKVAADHIRRRRVVVTPGSAESNLLEAVEREDRLLSGDFAVRLERIVEELLPVDVGTGVATGRLAIAEALHDATISTLRELIGLAIAGRHRVAILVDNLDKAWDRDADLVELSQFLLGLLAAMRPVAGELQRRDQTRQPVIASLAVFIRSDIYWHVTRNAREPDKLLVSRLDWTDQDLLVRVLEERYAVAQGVDGQEIWTKLFLGQIDGRATRDWILSAVLPRPRDLLYLANAAITNAVNRGHANVESADLKDARLSYSTYAIESVLVEGEQDTPRLEHIIFEFAGAQSRMRRSEAERRIRAGLGKKAPDDAVAQVISQLLLLSFLGQETAQEAPVFADNPQELVRASAIAQNVAAAAGKEVTYHVHPAFIPYLEIST
jgi:hypothetical protein